MSMSLSCDCNYDDAWYEWYANGFHPLQTQRRRRCKSCKRLIDIGADCMQFHRSRDSRTEIEERIYGDNGSDVPMASWYLCEECGEIYKMLSDLGFCMNLGEDMRENLKEYQRCYAHESWRKHHGCPDEAIKQ